MERWYHPHNIASPSWFNVTPIVAAIPYISFWTVHCSSPHYLLTMACNCSDFPLLTNILDSNESWADTFRKDHPGILPQTRQWPRILWFGCADSRVPESVVTGAMPGIIFVHRNIAKSVVFYTNHAVIESILVSFTRQMIAPMPFWISL